MKSYIPGLRIIKTFIAVTICLFIFAFANYEAPIYAAIACVLTMKESGKATKKIGINRILGTLIGGFVALLFLQIVITTGWDQFYFTTPTIASLSVLITLTICKIFNLDSYVSAISSVIAVITLLTASSRQLSALNYVVVRTIETIIGIVIAYLVNQYFFPKRSKIVQKQPPK